jgi:hypothetical protein
MAPLALEAFGLLDPLGLLFHFDPLCLMGLENHIDVGLLRLYLQAYDSAALAGPCSRASAMTTGLFLHSFLGSGHRSTFFFHGLTCNILA